METPEIIQQKIDKLNDELILSKQFYKYDLICNSGWSDDMIGFFNLGNARKILTLLDNGEILQYRHFELGTVDVYMNPNRNRIIVSDNETINENNIMSFIIMYNGEWYLNNEKEI